MSWGPETQVLSQRAPCSYRFRIILTKFCRVSSVILVNPKKFARLLLGNTSISPSIKPVCLRHRRRPWIQLFPKSQVVSKNPSNLKLWDFRSMALKLPWHTSLNQYLYVHLWCVEWKKRIFNATNKCSTIFCWAGMNGMHPRNAF